MKKYLKSYGIAFIIVAIYSFVKLPVLRLDFTSGFTTLILFFVLAGIIDMMLDRGAKASKLAKNNFIIALILLVLVIVVPFFITTPILHASAYKNLIGEVTESEFTEDVSPVNVNDIRIVDEGMAMKLGEKKIGEIPAIGSVSQLGTFHIQSVNGELYWVAPLVHRDIIKWITNLDGTDGYVMVSATDPQDVRLVQSLDGKPIKIKYQPEAYFLQDLHRYLYLKGIVNYGMTEFTLEIDDNGRPYWVVTLYDHKVGFSGSDAVGVAILDAQTGDLNVYDIENTPKWVDRIQPESLVINQIKDWGLYVKGFINSVFSEEGVLVPTEGASLVYGNDGKSYWYTGITSSGGDESTVGFMLVDSRTKEAKLYMQTGATETAAMTSAEGKVQEKNYEATFPVMYNIYGTPTYVCALKDKAGLVKSVAFISVEDYSVLGVGDNKKDALAAYKDALESDGEDLKFETDTDDVVLNDKIQRISADVQGGATTYYFTLQDNSKFIFKGTSKVSNELPLTNVGDNVVVTYTKTDATTINITKFENNSILGKLSTKTESKKDQKSSDENNDKTIKENNSSKSEDTKQNDSNSTQDKENKNN
ncbi:hypothetical protein [Intestinibacter bartlettii]|uniref:Cell shape-determining protein n=1 Tax=Intestinibacter bartlettii TaxID=261299 RepID=A0ABS8CXL6_9FIRM|nr:hypothetical protein [Intestinibacter bartlettii]MCB5397412.1 hypothetical protein [Intestinibacter bartlettii]MCB5403961.1 hypothetical protein [Intestinibacter bartlettii]MCB5446219.1 hypothetical protein [Intestinibacter bartlettii]MCB5748880.1 hypothetical protein [Intestinibacter bartlettii]